MGNDTPLTDALKAKTMAGLITEYPSIFGEWFVSCDKLERDRAELMAACEEALRWHQGDKWRDGDSTQRAAWERTETKLKTAISRVRGE